MKKFPTSKRQLRKLDALYTSGKLILMPTDMSPDKGKAKLFSRLMSLAISRNEQPMFWLLKRTMIVLASIMVIFFMDLRLGKSSEVSAPVKVKYTIESPNAGDSFSYHY